MWLRPTSMDLKFEKKTPNDCSLPEVQQRLLEYGQSGYFNIILMTPCSPLTP